MLHLLGKMMLLVLLGLSAASSHCAQDGSCTAPEHDSAAMLVLQLSSTPARTMNRRTALQAESSTAAHTSQEAIAILTTGTEKHFVQQSKVERLIKPLLDQGFRVDVYIQLVASGYEANVSQSKSVRVLEEGKIIRRNVNLTELQASIQQAGARLLYAELLNGQPSLTPSEDAISEYHHTHPTLWRVMRGYSPVDSNDTKRTVGLNVLRRYASLGAMMEKSTSVETAENFQYDMFLVTRDDDYWLGALDLGEIRNDPERAVSVYSKACRRWWGMNDKTLLFGREAANAIINNFTYKFIDLDNTYNFTPPHHLTSAEQILEALANSSGVKSKPLRFDQIPTVLARFDVQGTVCMNGDIMSEGENYSDDRDKCEAQAPLLDSLPRQCIVL